MKQRIGKLSICLLLLLFLLACGININTGAEEEPQVNQETAVAQTVAALEAEREASEPKQVPTITQQQDSVSQSPSETPLPCNKAKFVSETIPDNTQFNPNEAFVKTWRIRNVGTCTWDSSYRVVFAEGNQMGGPSSVNLSQNVAPNEVLDIVVNLTAPSANGDYTGVWKIKAPDGDLFTYFWAKIRVGAPAPLFAVTSVNLEAMHASITGTCPQTFHIRAYITTNGPGVVSYKFQDSVSTSYATKSTTFAAAETKYIENNLSLNSSGSYWVKIYIDEPNHQWWGPLNLTLVCTP